MSQMTGTANSAVLHLTEAVHTVPTESTSTATGENVDSVVPHLSEPVHSAQPETTRIKQLQQMAAGGSQYFRTMKKSRKSKTSARDVHFSVVSKVCEIIDELKSQLPSGKRRVPAEGCLTKTQNFLVHALKKQYGKEKAHDIAFHLTDWIGEGYFLVALSLFPERFTVKEIEWGVGQFLIHAPHHIAAASHLYGEPIEDIFGIGVSVRSQKSSKQLSGQSHEKEQYLPRS